MYMYFKINKIFKCRNLCHLYMYISLILVHFFNTSTVYICSINLIRSFQKLELAFKYLASELYIIHVFTIK